MLLILNFCRPQYICKWCAISKALMMLVENTFELLAPKELCT